MELVSAAVHFIRKAMHQQIQEVDQADEEVHPSQELLDLVNQVLETYNNRCAQQAGVFQADMVAYPLAAQAEKFIREELNLLEFSISVLGRIQQLMNNQLASTGGHLLFAHYRRNGDSFLLIVKLQTVQGQIFRSLTEVQDASHLSVDTLQVAARINLTSWQEARSERYVTFVSKREQRHTSNYFRDFIGCDVQAESRQESKKLATVVSDFVKAKMKSGELNEEDAASRMKHVFEHADGVIKRRETLSLDEVAAIVWPAERELFTRFLNEHPSPPVDNFSPDRNSLRSLSGYSYQSKEFKIAMTHEFKTTHNVTIDAHRLVIENPPERLIQELQN